MVTALLLTQNLCTSAFSDPKNTTEGQFPNRPPALPILRFLDGDVYLRRLPMRRPEMPAERARWRAATGALTLGFSCVAIELSFAFLPVFILLSSDFF